MRSVTRLKIIVESKGDMENCWTRSWLKVMRFWKQVLVKQLDV